MGWNFQREESNNNGGGFVSTIKAGDKLRVRVKSAQKATSKAGGNDMIVLQFDVSGHPDIIYHYITFMPQNPEMTNRLLTQFYDSFKDIPEGELDIQKWVGKVGAVKFKTEEYDGSERPKIHWFIKADKQSDLPAWVEPQRASADGAEKEGGFMSVPDTDDEEIPF